MSEGGASRKGRGERMIDGGGDGIGQFGVWGVGV